MTLGMVHLRVRFAAMAAGLMLSAGMAHAQARCPWLNVATASGVLNGPASLEMRQPAPNETHCLFRRNDSELTLEIVVKSQQDVSQGITAEQAACTSPVTRVQAIGNEALLCADDHKPTRGSEVIGRVRDSVFRVVIVTRARNDPALARDVLEQKARDTAEQVAGSLF